MRPRFLSVERAASSSARLREVEGASPKKKAHPRPVRPPSEEDETGPRQERSSAARPVRPPPAPPPPPRRSRSSARTHPSTKVVDDKNDRKNKDQEDKKQDVKKEKRKDDVKKDVKKDNTKKEKPKKEGKVPQAGGTVKTKSASSTCEQDIEAMIEIHQKDLSGMLEERKVKKTKSASTCGQDIGAMIEIHQEDLSGMLEERKVKKKTLEDFNERIRSFEGPIAEAQAKIKWLQSQRADHEKEMEAQVGEMGKIKVLLKLCRRYGGSGKQKKRVGKQRRIHERKRSVSE